MPNTYVNFISDQHLLSCIANLYKAYLNAKNNITKKTFFANKVDTIKLTFDGKFNSISEEDIIKLEVLRQRDKSFNNSVGTFHEQVLGGIEGFEIGNRKGFNITANDDTLFAVFSSEKLSNNISDAVFEKLASTANIFKKSLCYYVLLDDFSDTNEKWVIGHDEYSVSHRRVFKVSLNQFYAIVTNDNNAYDKLINALPDELNEFTTSLQPS